MQRTHTKRGKPIDLERRAKAETHQQRERVAASRSAQEITQLAARLIAEGIVTDFGDAKREAAARLGHAGRVPLPSNSELEAAVKSYLALFGGEEHAQLLAAMRESALALMRELADFEPRLTGAVASGLATEESDIVIQLHTDDEKSLEFMLMNQDIDFEAGTHRPHFRDWEGGDIPQLTFEWDGWPVRVLVYPLSLLRRNLKGNDGRTIARLDIRALEALIAETASQQEPPQT